MTAFFSSFWSILQTAFTWLLDGVVWVLKSVLYLIFDGLLTVVLTFFTALDVGQHLTSLASYFQLLPPQMVYIMNAIGLPQGLSIFFWAVVIRMLMNLIPSWLTRI